MIPSTRTEATPGTTPWSTLYTWRPLLEKKGIAKEVYNGMDETDKKVIQSKAMKSAKEVYLACLFILMADEEQYEGVKTALGDNCLLGQQRYPRIC